MKPSLADNQTSKGQVAVFVHSMQSFFPKVMQSARIFDQVAERLPDLLVTGACLDHEAEIDSLVRKGIEGTCLPTESAQKVNPDVLSTLREIEDSETSLTPGQAVAFAGPFFDAIKSMGTALPSLGLESTHQQALPELDSAYEIMPARCFDRIGTEWPVLLRPRDNDQTGGILEHDSTLEPKPKLTPVLSDGQWWIATCHPGRHGVSLIGGQGASSIHTLNVGVQTSCFHCVADADIE
jgi:hypothetical protein